MELSKIATVTRFWVSSCPDEALQRLKLFLDRAILYSFCIIVGIRVELDFGGTAQFVEEYSRTSPIPVIALPISPWNMFSTPLNILLFAASTYPNNFSQYSFSKDIIPPEAAQYILFQSIEIDTNLAAVQAMASIIEQHQALVVGTALPGSHEFQNGINDINGLTCPWNTNAMWHIPSLAKTGFLPVSDGIAGPSGPGMEEVATVSLLQHLGSGRTKAILVAFPENFVVWKTNFAGNPERRQLHAEKMNSKVERARKQLDILDIPAGKTKHIYYA